jgi:hypothetical protein
MLSHRWTGKIHKKYSILGNFYRIGRLGLIKDA